MGEIVSVVSIGVVDIQRTEYLSRKVMAEFTSYMAILKEILDKRPDNINQSANPMADDYNLLILSLKGLTDLARNGRVEDETTLSPYLQLLNRYIQAKVNGQETQATTFLDALLQYQGTSNPPNGYLSLLNGDMVQSLNDVMKSLKLVGLSPNSSLDIPDAEKVKAIQAWQSYAGFGVEAIMRKAVTLSSDAELFISQDIIDNQGKPLLVQRFPTRSLQSMLEIEYIKVANNIFTTNLNLLYNALGLTQDVLETLRGLQIISAQIRVSGKQPPFSPPTTDNINDYESQYRNASNAYFSQIFPSAIPSPTATRDLYAAKQRLSTQLSQLETINPNATRNTAGSLAQNLFIVIKDISAEFHKISSTENPASLYQTDPIAFETTFKSAVIHWIIDGQDVSVDNQGAQGSAFSIHTHLERATSAAENLNDTQRGDVRRYMFIFEEFYKSACAMLELVWQMIEKINRGVVSE